MKLSLWAKYGKSYVAAAYAVAVIAIPQFSGDHHVDAGEGIVIALAVANNLLVYVIPVTQRFGGIKSTINAVLAALAVAQTVIASGSDWSDLNNILLIVSAFLVAVGVTVAPAASPTQNAKVDAGSDAGKPI